MRLFKRIANLNRQKRIIFDSGIILIVSILMILPIILNGIPQSQDLPQQYQFSQTFYDSFLQGSFYPSWADHPNSGFGDVSVRFYPPLAYYLIGFFRLVSGNWFNASCLFFIFLYFTSGIGIYSWSRQYFSPNASLAGAVAYIFLPYHINQIYVGALFGETTAATILPFCFLFSSRTIQRGKLPDICGLAFFYGLLILSHIPTTIIASLTFTVFTIFSLKKSNFFPTIFKLSVGVILGLLLSSFYWVRMITELEFVKHNSEIYFTGNYSYKNQFIFSFLFPFADVAYNSPYALLNEVTIITLGIFLTFCVFFYHLNPQKSEHSIINVISATVFAFFMATPFSLIIWENFSVLQKIQFPFRWLGILMLGTAFVVCAGFDSAIENLKSSKRHLSILAFSLLLVCLPYNYRNLMSSGLTYPREDFAEMVNNFKTMPSYECWWSVWATKPPQLAQTESELHKIVLNDRTFEIKKWNATERVFTIEAGESGQASLATMYYPHWKANVGGKEVEVTPTDGGMISFPVSAEKSEVRVYFQEPPHIVTAFYISGFAWVIFLIILAFVWFKQKTPQIENQNEQHY